MSFEPRIVVFACNWCSYAGADLAGVSRMQYPATTRVIRVMCSGRVTPGFILEAFRLGADGVLVTGCHPGDCHYISGNQNAVVIVEKTSQLLHLLGIEDGRLRLEWISAAEGARFARIMAEFTDQVRALGPSPLGKAHGEEVLVSANINNEL
jgi:F420-non-reducing hydrogenase iron-sulfur subunit